MSRGRSSGRSVYIDPISPSVTVGGYVCKKKEKNVTDKVI